MEQKFNHREFDIKFDVVSEEWKCGALALSNKSFSALKRDIDREGKKRRQVNVDAYHLTERYDGSRYKLALSKVTIVLLREGDRKADVKTHKRVNEQVNIDSLYPLDQKKKLEAYIAAKARVEKAECEANELSERLISLTAATIREIVASNADSEA